MTFSREALKQALTILIDGMGRHPLHIIEIPLHYLGGKKKISISSRAKYPEKGFDQIKWIKWI